MQVPQSLLWFVFHWATGNQVSSKMSKMKRTKKVSESFREGWSHLLKYSFFCALLKGSFPSQFI